MNILSRATSNWWKTSRQNKLIALNAALVVIAVGATFVLTQAAGFFAAAEPEIASVSGNAKVVNDASASGGKAIQFNAPVVAPTPPAPSPNCNLTATTANFANQVSAASAGQTICLAAGNYGTWTGTNKAITIRPQDGANVTLAFDFDNGDAGFTIDGLRATFTSSTGMTITGGRIVGSANNITIKNANFTGGVVIDGVTNSNILFDHNQHYGLSYTNTTAAIHLSYSSPSHSGVTVQNSLMRDMTSDGIQTGPAMNILYNEFARIDPGNTPAHTDAVQLYSGSGSGTIGSIVRGNYFHDGEQAIGAFDGAGNSLIERNVIQNFSAHWITLMGDRPGSIIQFNTIVGSGARSIDCASKVGYQPSQTIIRNNIAGDVNLNGNVDCTPGQNTKNMFPSGASGTNFNGIPNFVGGSNPTTYEGFKLAPNSPGKNAATDGTDVGI